MDFIAWQQGVLRPLLEEKPPDPNGRAILFTADTDHTQAYVFESDKLPEIRGGSRQLAELNEATRIAETIGRLELKDGSTVSLPRDCVIFAGGGNVLALLPDVPAIADALKARLEQQYAEKTTVVTVSAAYRSFSVQQLTAGLRGEGGYFGQVVNLANMMLRRAKQERRRAPFIEVMPFAELCPSCQSRPVNQFLTLEDESTPICDICASKRDVGRRRGYWIRQLSRPLAEAGYILPEDVTYPQDIQEITGDDDIAFVYGDGDSIGEKLQRQESLHDYRELSNKLKEYTRQAVADAINCGHEALKLRQNQDGKWMTPWEIITIGGDDVLMLIPASAALKFATRLAEAFWQRGQKDDLRMSVGFAIAHPKTPVRLLREAAHKALRSAKKRSYETQTPCIDFHHFVKEGMISDSLSAMRRDNRALNDHTFLTGRPYSLDEIQTLQKNLDILRGNFPRSQLYSLCEELSQGAVRGSLFYHYQRARLPARKRTVLADVESSWQQNGQTPEWPWLRRPGNLRYTVLLDLVDLL